MFEVEVAFDVEHHPLTFRREDGRFEWLRRAGSAHSSPAGRVMNPGPPLHQPIRRASVLLLDDSYRDEADLRPEVDSSVVVNVRIDSEPVPTEPSLDELDDSVDDGGPDAAAALAW